MVVEFAVADVMTGKFCKLFGPTSLSQLSFGVTPIEPRSIPRPPLPMKKGLWAFEKIELPRIAFPVPAMMATPDFE